MNNNPDILTNVFGYDENEVEYERVTSNLRGYDLDYGIEVIFNYWRKKGFPHYQVREDEKHTHMRKLQKFDFCLSRLSGSNLLFSREFGSIK